MAPISVKVKNPPRALSVDEVAQLRTVLANDSHAIAMDLPDLVAIMLATGMRIGEACALRWEDVDLDAGTVAVTGTVLRVKGRGLYRKPAPKSKAGERVLELPSWAIVMLRRRSQTAEVVFPSPRGHLRDPSNTRRAMQQTYKRAGIGHLTSHVYRKTVASLLDDAGLPARAAADQLGHSQVTQTLNTYYGRKSRATGAADVLESLG